MFCRTHDNVTRVYLYMESRLGTEMTEPIGAPNVVKYRLLDMFTACTHPSVKDAILAAFTQKSNLRIVIATIAFGLGFNCPDVRRIIHWGPPNSVEDYLQETGQAGRDGLPAVAILYYNKTDLKGDHVHEDMKYYTEQNECVKLAQKCVLRIYMSLVLTHYTLC